MSKKNHKVVKKVSPETPKNNQGTKPSDKAGQTQAKAEFKKSGSSDK